MVNADGSNIGPFLVAADPVNQVLDTDCNLFLSVPGDLTPNLVALAGGPNGNTFSVELLDPPAGFFLNGTANSQILSFDQFALSGKVFNDGPNLAPVAYPDLLSAAPGQSLAIDVTANDVDVRAIDLSDPFNAANPANSNVHGLHPQALALVHPASGALIRSETITTAKEATVRRFTDFATGEASIQYTPVDSALALGIDSFSYQIQDRGGLLAAEPATVTVVVEESSIDRADLRGKTLKWDVAGTSNIRMLKTTVNGSDLYFTPLAGVWNTPARLESAGSGSVNVTVLRDAGGSVTDLDFTLQLDGLGDITAAHIHSGALGTTGPIAVTLFDADGDAASVAGPTAVASPLVVTPETRFPAGDPRNTALVTDVDDPAGGPFADLDALVAAIEAGTAYVQIHTLANLPGEIRGQLGRNTVSIHAGADTTAPLVGTAVVENDGSWTFSGKSTISPGAALRLSTGTSAGARTLDIPLRLR